MDEPKAPERIEGRRDWLAALQAAVEEAALHERELCLVDANFENWPLDDARVLAGLVAFAKKPLRRVVIVAAQFDQLSIHHPQFTRWRRDWSHVIDCRQTDVEMSQVPTLVLAGVRSVHLGAPAVWRGHVLRDEKERRDWRDVVDALLQRSEPGFAATTLGL